MNAKELRIIHKDVPRDALAKILEAAQSEAIRTARLMDSLREAQKQRRVKIRVLQKLLQAPKEQEAV